jgi:hypothetical protein
MKVIAGKRFVMAEAKVVEVSFKLTIYKFCAIVPLREKKIA